MKHPAARSLIVVEVLEAVIEWHERGVIPPSLEPTSDPRCRFIHSDFFALTDVQAGFDPANPGRKFHAVLLDIDHLPRNLLHTRHGTFYEPAGLRGLVAHLHPGGVFALWSGDPADEPFLAALCDVFDAANAQVVAFYNPLLEGDSASTVYIAYTRSKPLGAPSPTTS